MASGPLRLVCGTSVWALVSRVGYSFSGRPGCSGVSSVCRSELLSLAVLLDPGVEVSLLDCEARAQVWVPVPLVQLPRLVERLCFLAHKHRICHELDCHELEGVFWISFSWGERRCMSPWLASLRAGSSLIVGV